MHKKHENELNAAFWNECWQTNHTGWDIGYASTPLKEYINQYSNKKAAILIPGCGNAYEASYLIEKNFTNITLIDIAEEAVLRLKEKFKNYHQVTILCENFFQHQGKYDLIIEQTFFCAQVLERRKEYVEKIASLLNNNGKLIGVLFNVDFEKQGPPFGGNKVEYETLFSPYFHIHTMQSCYNSIQPRAGSELFINLIKK
ncbi:MAG: methyltransferase [Bacteroidetes bacterium]|nr:methyltransferase [Bacteroidota bacterium]MBS1648241.1 methyltransferase [Bacteroidota bacterium]